MTPPIETTCPGVAHCGDERRRAAARIAELEAEVERLRARIAELEPWWPVEPYVPGGSVVATLEEEGAR